MDLIETEIVIVEIEKIEIGIIDVGSDPECHLNMTAEMVAVAVVGGLRLEGFDHRNKLVF